jgi:hypothetical protein
MDRNAEAFLRRTKAGSKLDRLAMRGPARVLIRYFLNVPRSHRHEYYSARTRDGGSISQGLEGS